MANCQAGNIIRSSSTLLRCILWEGGGNGCSLSQKVFVKVDVQESASDIRLCYCETPEIELSQTSAIVTETEEAEYTFQLTAALSSSSTAVTIATTISGDGCTLVSPSSITSSNISDVHTVRCDRFQRRCYECTITHSATSNDECYKDKTVTSDLSSLSTRLLKTLWVAYN